MSSSAHRQIVHAIERLRSGVDALSAEGYLHLLDAIEHASSVLQLAPAGADPVATGVWYHHERGVALARLADALRVDQPTRGSAADPGSDLRTRASAESEYTRERRHNAQVIRALQESIQG